MKVFKKDRRKVDSTKMSNSKSKAITIATYDKDADMFDRKFNRLGARKADINKAFSYIKQKGPFVFELGCGNGRDAKEILKMTDNYIGIDASKALIAKAKEKAPSGRFETADFESYRFPPEIDIIFAFASLLHTDKESFKDILNRACRSLNKGGVFFLSLKYGQYQEKIQDETFGKRVFYYYTPELVKKLAGNKYRTVWEDIRDLRGQRWFIVTAIANQTFSVSGLKMW
ncbi:MAG: class I SAM-dependent methyltransferase [Patescibacteria group bacterium]|nr:class I SAM-dependent methyltransferase [Patescibacteria group bacterium]